MSTLDERFQQGVATRARMGGGTPTAGSVPTSRDMAPDLHRIAGEALFGSIWTRPALSVQHREMSTLSVLTALQRENQIRQHTGNALNMGLTPTQVIEVFIHLAFYTGVPAAFNAMGIAKVVFDQKGVAFTPQLVYNPAEDPETLHQRGTEKRYELMGDHPPGSSAAPLTAAEGALTRLTSEYLFGSIWTRPGLDMQSRSLCTLSALTALGHERQLRSHIRGALRIGWGQEEIVEIFVHTVFYAGLPAARTAIEVANEVFREG